MKNVVGDKKLMIFYPHFLFKNNQKLGLNSQKNKKNFKKMEMNESAMAK